MVARAGQNLNLLLEKVEILYGNRGNPKEWALRRGELVDVQKIIADVRKSLDDLKKSLQQVKDDIDQINVRLGDAETRLNEAEQAINDLEAILQTLEKRIASAEGALTQLEQAIAKVNTQVGTIGGDLKGVQDDVATIKQNVTSINSAIDALTQRVSAVESAIASVFCLQSNPGATPFTNGVFRAIPFYTPGESTGITLTSNTQFKVSKAGLYQFELEVRINGGLSNMFPIGAGVALSIDTTTVPTTPRAGYSVADQVKTLTILRLVCVERLAANDVRVAYLLNQGMASYQVASAVIKIVRISA